MTITIEQLNARVSTTDRARAEYNTLAAKWEKMWMLDPGFTQGTNAEIEKSGREKVITAEPYNVVNLAQRLIATAPRIDCPPKGDTDKDREVAEGKESFLRAMWQQVIKLTGRNIMQDASWMSLVRGRCVFEVKWIKEELPKKLRDKQFPILIRVLDPAACGVHRGPLYVEYAYHKYEDTAVNVKQRYPKLDCWDKEEYEDEAAKITVTDFWYRDKDANVWNAVVCGGEFAKKPKKTSYEFIPIIEVYGDSAPTRDEAFKGMSILHSIDGAWQYKCRLQSSLGTGVLWATWPFFLVTNEDGQEQEDINVRPGATQNAAAGTKVQEILPSVNLNMIEAMLNKVDEGLQQSTFPSVLYGEAGSMQAGYGVSLLSDAAKGRIKSFIEYLEIGVMLVNEAVFALIDAMDDDDKGVELWGKDAKSGGLYKYCLYKKDLGGYYENLVTLRPNLPQDDMARMGFGLQMVNSGNLSQQTFWNKWVSIDMPNDEQARIWQEQLFKEPSIAQNLQLRKLIVLFPDEWKLLIKGTVFEEVAARMLGPDKPPPPPPDMGPPPDMMGGMPPGAPPMGPPPGMMPPGGPLPLQPPAIPMPMGGGIPPAMQGQIEPEMLGLPPAGDPALFAQMMGQPLSDPEQLRLLAGMPQEGMPRDGNI